VVSGLVAVACKGGNGRGGAGFLLLRPSLLGLRSALTLRQATGYPIGLGLLPPLLPCGTCLVVEVPMSPRFPRWGLFVIALLVLVADLWSKDWAVQNLANARHPMIVTTAGGPSPQEAFAARGVTAAELEKAANNGLLVGLKRAQGLDPQQVLQDGEGVELYFPSGTHLPGPRRVRVSPDHPGETLAAAVAREVLVDQDEAAVLIKDVAMRASSVARQPDLAWALQGADAVALGDRDIVVIDGFFHFVYAENFGAAWSFLSTAPAAIRVTLFVLMALGASIALSLWLARGNLPSTLTALALAGVLGGALGNLIDRVRYGAVVDFVFNFITIDGDIKGWPVYNVADIGISCGVVALALELLTQREVPGAPPAPGISSPTALSTAPIPDTHPEA
jgi:signal peptidase II